MLSLAASMLLCFLALWLLFATTLNSSLGWLQRRLRLASLLGAISGPLCYRAGEALGALQLGSPVVYAATAVEWALMMPLGLLLARRVAAGASRD